MDLAQLAQLRQQSTRLQSTRHDSAKQYLDDGLSLLDQAQQSHFGDATLLLQSYDHLLKALQFKRSDPEAYVAIGYIFILLQDFDTALRYLRSAQEVAPSDEDAAFFIAYIQTKVAHGKHFAKTERDYDAWYDRVEADIHTYCQELSTQWPEPTANAGALEQIKQQLKQGQQAYEQLQTDLQQIDTEIDVSELRLALLPMEDAMRHYILVIDTSARMLVLKQGMQEVTQAVEQQWLTSYQMGQSTAELEQELEAVLDHCDRFADDLDVFEAEGYSIAPLSPVYEQLLKAVEQFREQIDERSEA